MPPLGFPEGVSRSISYLESNGSRQWVNDANTVGDNDHYLLTRNNYALIQTGHSIYNGISACTPDEAKIIANMIYYTCTLNNSSTGDDYTVKDQAAPDLPDITGSGVTTDQLDLTINSKDNPTNYYYRIKAKTATTTKYSDTVKVPVLSGFKGYIYLVDDNPTGTPPINKDANGNITNINLQPNSATDEHASLSLTRLPNAGKYLHLVAVDQANNISAVKTVNLADYLWWKVENSVLTIYPHQLNFERDRTFYPDSDGTYKWPWYSQKENILKVVVKPGVNGAGNIQDLFLNLTSVTMIEGLANLDTSQVTNMSRMFELCKSITSLDVTHFATSQVTNMSHMFAHCYALTSLDVTHFDTGAVTNMEGMFDGCNLLTSLDVTHFATSKVTNMSYMFEACSGLTSLDVTNFDTSAVTNMEWMFNGCSGLTSLDVTHFDTSNVTNMRRLFSQCSYLTSLDVSHFDTSNVTNMSYMFTFCRSVPSLDVTNFDTSAVTNMEGMFDNCTLLTSLDVTHFDTSNVTSMYQMFADCNFLPSLDVTHFDTSNVTNMHQMFYVCAFLNGLDVSHFDTSKVTDMTQMFASCWSMTSLDVSHFDTSKVTDMSKMFMYCRALTSLDLSNFDLSAVQNNGVDSILGFTDKLWKLTLGPKTYLQDRTDANGIVSTAALTNPVATTRINDLAHPRIKYYCTDAKWQEVGTGTDHKPTGQVLSAADILAESATRNDFRTYVWYQLGRQTLSSTTSTIDFGSHQGSLLNHDYLSSKQTLNVTDNRNERKAKTWRIEGAMTRPFTLTTDSTKQISGNPLIFQDSANGVVQPLSATAQTLYSFTPTDDYQDLKSYDWQLKFKSTPNQIPGPGTYQAQVTYTLVNPTP